MTTEPKPSKCNRTACPNQHEHWYNPHMYAYYCKPCAVAINVHLSKEGLKLITKDACPPHDWDKDGERCTKCGDKDWM